MTTPPMPADPPTAITFDLTPSPASASPAAPAPAAPAAGGVLAPVALTRPTRDTSGGSAAYTSGQQAGSAEDKPAKEDKNTATPGMWKGIAAYIANRPQRKVQHTISETRGASTDRKINHGITEKRGATSDSKSNRTATTAHANKSDKSAKNQNSRDAKTSAASTKGDKNHSSRDTKAADTRSAADKSSRDAKAASDRKDHNTRQQAGKTAADTQARTARDDKTSRTKDSKPSAKDPRPKTPAAGAARADKASDKTARDKAPAKAGDKADVKLTKVKPDPTQPPQQPPAGPPTPPAPAPAAQQGKDKPRKGPYTAQPAREKGFQAGAQLAADEADKAAFQDGYADGQQAIRDKADRDKAQMDAARDRTRGVPPVPATPPVPQTPPAPGPAPGGVQPLGAKVAGNTVHLSNGSTMTRGEIRSLRGLTRFLAGKEAATHHIADECRQAQEVSAGRVQQIQGLIEKCQDPKVKAGKHLIASLQRLHEATQAQGIEAARMHANAQRGIEALRTLNRNAETRHGGVYKAVADSPESTPGERAFYAR